MSGDTSQPVAGATGGFFTAGPLTATTSFWVRIFNSPGFVNSAAATVQVLALPDIAVKDNGASPAAELVSGIGAVNLGNLNLGATASRVFLIQNSGNAPLTGLATSKDGPQAEGLTISQPAVTSLNAGGTTTFSVQFSPTIAGSNTATVHIVSNDPDESPFNIVLAATGPSAQELWRQQYFGTSSNTGTGAETADPDHDGSPNLMEFAIHQNPTVPGSLPMHLTGNGSNLEVRYPRANAALVDGIQLFVEWSDSLNAPTWSTSSVTESSESNDGTVQQIKAVLPKGSGASRFIRLHALRP